MIYHKKDYDISTEFMIYHKVQGDWGLNVGRFGVWKREGEGKVKKGP